MAVRTGPCWVQVPLERTNTHAPAATPLGVILPISAVLPSAESAMLDPNSFGSVVGGGPITWSFGPCWVQVLPERVNTHTAPLLSPAGPLIRAVFPSADSATRAPKPAAPVSPLPVSLDPCCVHVLPERVNTQ